MQPHCLTAKPERVWLHQASLDPAGRPDPSRLYSIRRREAAIISAGVRRVIYGRELLGRWWWSWRREADGFSGQETLDIARDALEE